MSREQGRANQVRAFRLAADLTQARLAEQAGVSRQTVNALESGDYAPSVYLALRLAEVLSATVEELFGRAGGAQAGSRAATKQEQR
jgi:putative transcriptional regulator